MSWNFTFLFQFRQGLKGPIRVKFEVRHRQLGHVLSMSQILTARLVNPWSEFETDKAFGEASLTCMPVPIEHGRNQVRYRNDFGEIFQVNKKLF